MGEEVRARGPLNRSILRLPARQDMQTDNQQLGRVEAISIERFEFRNASEEALVALNECGNRLRAERWPDDPPVELEETVAQLRSIPPFVDLQVWSAWERPAGREARIVATGRVTTFDMLTNRHAAELNLGVLPEYRRRGLGTRLLALAADAAASAGRRLLVAMT